MRSGFSLRPDFLTGIDSVVAEDVAEFEGETGVDANGSPSTEKYLLLDRVNRRSEGSPLMDGDVIKIRGIRLPLKLLVFVELVGAEVFNFSKTDLKWISSAPFFSSGELRCSSKLLSNASL